MEINVPPGKYIIAVSGGVDSMVLLDVLRQNPSVELVVAHFNHGIMPDSSCDE
jgi:tRNA(Ile)-lysidine synthase TilS/MesJ